MAKIKQKSTKQKGGTETINVKCNCPSTEKQSIDVKLSTMLEKLNNININSGMKQNINNTVIIGFYFIAILLIIGLIGSIIFYFFFDITVLSGFSQLSTALTSLLSIIFIIYLLLNNFLLTKSIFYKSSLEYSSESFIKNITKVILSSIYSLFIVIIIALALGFMLSLSLNLSSSNYNNFINPIFNITKLGVSLILLLIIIFFIFSGNFEKTLSKKYPFVILATCIQYLIFLGILFLFKSLSDYILNNILKAPDVRNMEILDNLDTNVKITEKKINKIKFNIQSLSDLIKVEDYSAIDDNNLNYLIFLSLYFVYMLTIVFGFIALIKFKINYEEVSIKIGNIIKTKMKEFVLNLGVSTTIFEFKKEFNS